MKKFYVMALSFIAAMNLYCFDLIEDTFDFIFDDLAKVVGIVVIIAVLVYFVKRASKKNDSERRDQWKR